MNGWRQRISRGLRAGGRLFILGYQAGPARFLGLQCRFVPSCSHYALECLDRFAFPRAMELTIRRLLRCHPLGGRGWDPVPEQEV